MTIHANMCCLGGLEDYSIESARWGTKHTNINTRHALMKVLFRAKTKIVFDAESVQILDVPYRMIGAAICEFRVSQRIHNLVSLL